MDLKIIKIDSLKKVNKVEDSLVKYNNAEEKQTIKNIKSPNNNSSKKFYKVLIFLGVLIILLGLAKFVERKNNKVLSNWYKNK